LTVLNSLTQQTIDELETRQRRVMLLGGVRFARKGKFEQKDAAREMILNLFSLENYPGEIRIMTMPGVDWKFERLLLARREPGWTRGKRSYKTYFTSAESNREIYFSSATQMPGIGLESGSNSSLFVSSNSSRSFNRPPPFAEYAIKSRYCSFFFCNINDTIEYAIAHKWKLHGAWLDYTGPLTIKHLTTIAKFYRECITGTLAVTALKARWDRVTGVEINQFGYEHWLHRYLPGEKLHFIEYFDTSPMLQFAVKKPSRYRPKFSGVEDMRWGDDGGRNI
jgi:hypothetical protein